MEIYKRIYFRNIMKVYFSLIAAFLLAFGLIFFSSTEKANCQTGCYDDNMNPGVVCPPWPVDCTPQVILIGSTTDPFNYICPVTVYYKERICTDNTPPCPPHFIHELWICRIDGPSSTDPNCSDWYSLLWKGNPPVLDVDVLGQFYIACYSGLSAYLYPQSYPNTNPDNLCIMGGTPPCQFPNPYCIGGTYEFFIPNCMGICYKPASHNPPSDASSIYEECPNVYPAPTCCGFLIQFCWCLDKTGWHLNRSETLFSTGMPPACPPGDSVQVCPPGYIAVPNCTKMCPDN
jgi:hypothetical protein